MAATRHGSGPLTLHASLVRNLQLRETVSLQLRVESFNATNHTSLGVPVKGMASPSFGRIVEAGPPRLFQAAVKLMF